MSSTRWLGISFERWLAIFSFIVAAMLFFSVYVHLSGLRILSDPSTWGTVGSSEYETYRTVRLFLLLEVAQGAIFGGLLAVAAIGVWSQQTWAFRTVFVTSIALTAVAAGIIILVPYSWRSQGGLIALCATYWWGIRINRRTPSAP